MCHTRSVLIQHAGVILDVRSTEDATTPPSGCAGKQTQFNARWTCSWAIEVVCPTHDAWSIRDSQEWVTGSTVAVGVNCVSTSHAVISDELIDRQGIWVSQYPARSIPAKDEGKKDHEDGVIV